MTKTFTPNDALRYLYGEMNERERVDFELELVLDARLRTLTQRFERSLTQIERAPMPQPSQAVVDRILAYSASVSPAAEMV